MEQASEMFRLKLKDLGKGLVTAVFGGIGLAVIAVLQPIFGTGFDVFAIDWIKVGHDLVNAAIMGAESGFVGYLTTKFFSDKNGAVFGKIGGNKQ